MAAHFDGKRPRTQPMAEEAGVEPTEDAWRPPTGLKPARVTGPDTLPPLIPLRFFCSVKLVFQNRGAGFPKFVPMTFLVRSVMSGSPPTCAKSATWASLPKRYYQVDGTTTYAATPRVEDGCRPQRGRFTRRRDRRPLPPPTAAQEPSISFYPLGRPICQQICHLFLPSSAAIAAAPRRP